VKKTVVSLDHLSPEQRVDFWRTALTETFVPVDLMNYKANGFDVSIETVELGDLEVSHLTGVEQDIFRSRSMIRSGDADPFIAVLQLDGSMGFEHNGKQANGLSGSVTLFDTTQEYVTMMRDKLNIIDVTIPRPRIEALFGSTRHLAGLTLDGDHPMTKLVIEFFRHQMQMPAELSKEDAARLGAVGGDLLAAAFLEKIGRSPGLSTSAAAMVRAKAFIRDRLGDHTLTPEMVATSQGISLRRMQELFAAESLSIGDYIWEQRLLRAYGMLRSKGLTRISVAEVAYAVGFVSLPHFSRRFRARFGYTPVETRRLIEG
jgi:AraC-like DNA-binding protein